MTFVPIRLSTEAGHHSDPADVAVADWCEAKVERLELREPGDVAKPGPATLVEPRFSDRSLVRPATRASPASPTLVSISSKVRSLRQARDISQAGVRDPR